MAHSSIHLSQELTGSCTAFQGARCVATGNREQITTMLKGRRLSEHQGAVLVFDDETGDQIELDLRDAGPIVAGKGTSSGDSSDSSDPSDLPQTGRGRPRLGVVSREVTLLPRHWEWLNRQPGGASVALRKLVEEARRTHAEQDLRRQSQSAAFKFMTAMAGDRPGYEEAVRALFAGKRVRYELEIERWPVDVRNHALKLAAASFGEKG